MTNTELSMWQASAERMALDPYPPIGDAAWRFRAGARPAAGDVVAVLSEAVAGTAIVPWPRPHQALALLRRLGTTPWRITGVTRQGPRQRVALSVGSAALALEVETAHQPYLRALDAHPSVSPASSRQ